MSYDVKEAPGRITLAEEERLHVPTSGCAGSTQILSLVCVGERCGLPLRAGRTEPPTADFEGREMTGQDAITDATVSSDAAAYGTRPWALHKILAGRRVRLRSWGKKEYLYLDRIGAHGSYIRKTVADIGGTWNPRGHSGFRLEASEGWELYLE